MPAEGYIQVHAYTSEAQIPLPGTAIAILADDGRLLAVRLTNASGQIQPVPVEVPDLAESLDLDIYQYRVSLSTQSMNIKSLQKNMEMHRTVLNHLVEAFANFAPNAQPNTARFMARSIAGMAGMQLYIYLSLADVKGYQTVTRQMMAEIRQKSPALYRQVNQAPTFRLLAWSRFALFPWFAARQQKKLGLKA